MKIEPELTEAKLREEWPQICRHLSVMAKLHREKYNALLAQGFTEAQALELCKTVLHTP